MHSTREIGGWGGQDGVSVAISTGKGYRGRIDIYKREWVGKDA